MTSSDPLVHGSASQSSAMPPMPPVPTATDDVWIERPRLLPGVEVHAPAEDGAPWLVQSGASSYFRIGSDLARLASNLDGTRDIADLQRILGPRWSVDNVRQSVEMLRTAKLLDTGQKRRDGLVRRVKVVPPASVQFAVTKSSYRFARVLATVLRPVFAHGFAMSVVVGLAGIVVLATMASDVRTALDTPVPIALLGAVLLGIVATTVIHELSHAALLAHYGGRPGRMGVMIFYFSPAFFCDVSDSWRLPRNVQRTRVALAGIAAQSFVAGAGALTLPFTSADIRTATVLFVIVNYLAGLINLVPFVKLDGYIALMTHLDRPNLRADSMARVRRSVAEFISVGRVPGADTEQSVHERDRDRRLLAFGIACIVTPVVLLWRALETWSAALLQLGYIGQSTVVALAAVLLFFAVRSVARVVRDAARVGLRPMRVVAAAVILGAVATVVSLWPVGSGVGGGYRTTASGELEIVVPVGSDSSSVAVGDAVDLRTSGLMLNRSIGAATIVSVERTSSREALSAVSPVILDGPTVLADVYVATVDNDPGREAGGAIVARSSTTVWSWLATSIF